MEGDMKKKELSTDVLIIGGGTAGCFAAMTFGKEKNISVLIAEKANIRRSGCLAAGVNAINAYITEGRVPQDYVDSVSYTHLFAVVCVSYRYAGCGL